MVEATQVEQRPAFEGRTPPVEQAGREVNRVARDDNRTGSNDGTQGASPTGASNPADSVEISAEAQRVAANDSENAARPDAERNSAPQNPDSSASAETGSAVDETTHGGAPTNQFTSFTSERTGNDTRNDTEAGRTLGQVIDTFA